jgi:hypothetical protein
VKLPVVELFLPLALGFIMFALGLTLVVDDFRRLLTRPKAVLAGLVGQVLVVPAAAWGIALAWGLSAEMAVGLMILAACPGGVSSGLLTHLARGDTALSITLTAITSVAAVATVPFIVDLALRHFMNSGAGIEFPLASMVRGVFLLTTVPVVLGMGLRAWRPAFAMRVEVAAGRIATVLFVLIVLATFFSQRQVLAENLGLAAGAGLERRDCIAVATDRRHGPPAARCAWHRGPMRRPGGDHHRQADDARWRRQGHASPRRQPARQSPGTLCSSVAASGVTLRGLRICRQRRIARQRRCRHPARRRRPSRRGQRDRRRAVRHPPQAGQSLAHRRQPRHRQETRAGHARRRDPPLVQPAQRDRGQPLRARARPDLRQLGRQPHRGNRFRTAATACT